MGYVYRMHKGENIIAQGNKCFQKSRRHLKILDARRVTWSRLHTEHTQIRGTTVENVVARGLSIPNKVYRFLPEKSGRNETTGRLRLLRRRN